MVKKLSSSCSGQESPANSEDAGDSGLIPGQEDPLEREVVTQARILAWEIPGIEKPGSCSPPGLQKSRR